MAEYNKYFDDVLGFINTYQDLVNCHMVDFITDKLWDKCLPIKLKSELKNVNMNYDIWKEDNLGLELSNFIQLTKSLSLETCPEVLSVNDILKILPQYHNSKEQLVDNKLISSKPEFMKSKKSYEVEVVGKIIAEVASVSQSLVIDAGAGKAYLSTFLSENYNIPVLAIDSSHICHEGAMNRQEKLRKRKKSLIKVCYAVQKLDDRSDYDSIVNMYYPDWNINKNLILTGLHTCGMLVHSTINAFIHTENINLLFIVPCCYHLVNETLSGNLSFSKNARMLAQQSIERSKYNKYFSPVLFYRAVLQVVLHSIGFYNTKVGRGGPLNNFVDYAKWALSKIGVDNKKIPSANVLQEIYQKYAHLEPQLRVFQMLRIYSSSVVEAAIMLDRIVYLENSAKCSKIAVVRLFDPTLSPRCYAIVATK